MPRISTLRLGIVTNEILEPGLSRLGGFGYAASSVADVFAANPQFGVNATIVACERLNTDSHQTSLTVKGVRVLLRQEHTPAWADALRREALDLLLCIDYRSSYDLVLGSRTPAIIWVQDPRTWEDVAHIRTLTVPGSATSDVPGIAYTPTRGLLRIAVQSVLTGRGIAFPFTSPDLRRKFRSCYGFPPAFRTRVLPFVTAPTVGPMLKSQKPLVVFLGRLDPIKRPWIAVELARAMPDVRVAVLGQNHFPEAWQPRDPPSNVELVGHVSGEEKAAWLSQGWVLLNSSIHEALPVSFLEALAHEMPIVSCVDPGGIVSSYGLHVPMSAGDGLQTLPAFSAAVRRLVEDRALALRLGQAGREWVTEHHSLEEFMRALRSLCRVLGVERGTF